MIFEILTWRMTLKIFSYVQRQGSIWNQFFQATSTECLKRSHFCRTGTLVSNLQVQSLRLNRLQNCKSFYLFQRNIHLPLQAYLVDLLGQKFPNHPYILIHQHLKHYYLLVVLIWLISLIFFKNKQLSFPSQSFDDSLLYS